MTLLNKDEKETVLSNIPPDADFGLSEGPGY